MNKSTSRAGVSAIIIIVAIVAVVVVVGGIYYYLASFTQPNEPSSQIQNEEAKSPSTIEAGGQDSNSAPEGGSDNGGATGQESSLPGGPSNNGSSQGSSDGGTAGEQAPALKTFNVIGRKFAFSPSEIRVSKGDRVKINFQSSDGFHEWVIDEFAARTSQINTGESASVEFVADKAGIFEYYCSVGNHRQMGMVGKLIVE